MGPLYGQGSNIRSVMHEIMKMDATTINSIISVAGSKQYSCVTVDVSMYN